MVYMERKTVPAIVATERHNDGLIVRFADGKCVFYPVALLYTTIPQACLQDESATVW